MKTADSKQEIIKLVIAFLGVMTGVLINIYYNSSIMEHLPIILRMLLSVLIYWIIAAVPIAIDRRERRCITDEKDAAVKVSSQILTGIGLALLLSVVLTLIPHIIGLGKYVSNDRIYSCFWQYIYEFVYCIFSVAAVEEYVFRGFFFERIVSLTGSIKMGIGVSSVLFGLIHVFSGDVLQLFITAVMGALFCVFRLKIKKCTLLSLIVMHGIYDAMITVWVNAFI